MNYFTRIDQNQALINQLRPFEGQLLRQIKDFYRIDLTWSSNAIEGNTLTESETKVLIEDGLTIGGKPLRHTLEALGHARAYDYMFQLMNKKGISQQDILELHRLFYLGIDEGQAGVYRNQEVLITGSSYAVTESTLIAEKMEQLCLWMDREAKSFHPVEFAAKLHKELVFIHPFIDGNGRVARLLMNASLIQNKLVPVIIPPILRQDYIASLERAHIDDSVFVTFIAEREVEAQKDLMRFLHIKA